MKIIIPLMACIALTGCSWFAHKAKRVEVPSAAAIHMAADKAEKSTALAAKAATKAGEHLIKAKARHGEAISSHKVEENHIADASKKVEDLRLRVTVELRPKVDALASDIAQLRAQHSTTNAALLDTGAEVGEATVATSEAATAAKAAQVEQEAIRVKHSPEYEAKVSEIVAKANATEKAYAKADAERLNLLGQKTFLITISALSIIVALVLKFYRPL